MAFRRENFKLAQRCCVIALAHQKQGAFIIGRMRNTRAENDAEQNGEDKTFHRRFQALFRFRKTYDRIPPWRWYSTSSRVSMRHFAVMSVRVPSARTMATATS